MPTLRNITVYVSPSNQITHKNGVLNQKKLVMQIKVNLGVMKWNTVL